MPTLFLYVAFHSIFNVLRSKCGVVSYYKEVLSGVFVVRDERGMIRGFERLWVCDVWVVGTFCFRLTSWGVYCLVGGGCGFFGGFLVYWVCVLFLLFCTHSVTYNVNHCSYFLEVLF